MSTRPAPPRAGELAVEVTWKGWSAESVSGRAVVSVIARVLGPKASRDSASQFNAVALREFVVGYGVGPQRTVAARVPHA
jgi:hypothetical protein